MAASVKSTLLAPKRNTLTDRTDLGLEWKNFAPSKLALVCPPLKRF